MRTTKSVALLACSLAGGATAQHATIHAPYGVNFGSWLCLEDWFFSGKSGRYVSTPDSEQGGQGGCLPPGVPGPTEPWASEGLLVKRLNTSEGPSKTAEYFTAHRYSYITANDFEAIANLGIRAVRVPLTWAAFADALGYIDPVYTAHDPDKEAAVVPDPFYADTHALVTVPRKWLAGMIKHAGTYGLQILLDLHAMPGGSAIGTYNGIWPSPPVMFTRNATLNTSAPLKDAGLAIAKAMVDWVESLDKETRRAVGGLTLMNEPAHLSAIQKGPNNTRYVEEPDILAWLTTAGDIFRQSRLPQMGVKLYVNIIQTAFADFFGTVAPWFAKTFSKEERLAWAVADVHWYTAWNGSVIDGDADAAGSVIDGDAYRCDDPIADIKPILQRAVSGFVNNFIEHFPIGLRSCSEFSAGTNQDARYACNDKEVLRMFLQTQVTSMQMHDIQPFFWTWRMPYGSVFEPGWSLKHLAGLEETPAETCNSLVKNATGAVTFVI